jgi:hypothetical protein
VTGIDVEAGVGSRVAVGAVVAMGDLVGVAGEGGGVGLTQALKANIMRIATLIRWRLSCIIFASPL